MARLATILSFGDRADDDAVPEQHAADSIEDCQDDDAASDASDDSFEFAFARPLIQPHSADALADDLFAHGRIVPSYPVFRRHPHDDASTASSATAPPSPDTYCAWAPRSAPGSPARDLPKSASTGQAVHRFRLRDLVGAGAGAGSRSHSDGKDKFLFLQQQPSPASKTKSSKTSPPPAAAAAPAPATKKPQAKQGKKKGAAVTEMDMATAHRLFYSKPTPAAAAASATNTTTTKKSYLPYRPSIVGFFAAAHGLRPKHHPY